MTPSLPPPDGRVLTEHGRLRPLVRDFFTPLGEPFADARRYTLALRIHLLLGPTVVLGPPAWMYLTTPAFRDNPALDFALWKIWFPSAVAFSVLVLLGVLVGAPREGSPAQRIQRTALLCAIVPMVTTSHASSWMFGTLTNPAVAILVALIAGYRVLIDYASAFVVMVVALLGYVGVATLELSGVIRAQPFLDNPRTNPAYSIPELGWNMVTGAVTFGEVLNAYLRGVADLAHEHGATVDKFIGDAVMIVIGAPEALEPEEQARRAASLARAIHAAVAALDTREPLSARTGINTGEVVVGNFGSEVRSDYTVVGPAVNVAARLEAASQPNRILVGPRTASLLDEPLEAAGEFRLKGVTEPVEAFFLPA